MSIEERFTKIVREMSDELESVQKRNAELKSRLRVVRFPGKMICKCGVCGEEKHTPWRDDEFGNGNICVGCLVKLKDEQLVDLEKRIKKLKNEYNNPRGSAANRVKVLNDALECLIAVVRAGEIPSGGESTGNMEHLLQCIRDIRDELAFTYEKENK